jgi:hypothetical protein
VLLNACAGAARERITTAESLEIMMADAIVMVSLCCSVMFWNSVEVLRV